jgi:hypothetical protein
MCLLRREYLGFLLICMGFHTFNHCHSKLALEFGYSLVRFIITRIMSCYYYELKRNNIDSARRKMLGFYFNYYAIP